MKLAAARLVLHLGLGSYGFLGRARPGREAEPLLGGGQAADALSHGVGLAANTQRPISGSPAFLNSLGAAPQAGGLPCAVVRAGTLPAAPSLDGLFAHLQPHSFWPGQRADLRGVQKGIGWTPLEGLTSGPGGPFPAGTLSAQVLAPRQ